MKKVLVIFFAVVVFSFGCTHRPFVSLIVKPVVTVVTCDTANVSYRLQIQPMLRNNCYECHGSAVTASGGLDLEDFTSLKNYLLNGFRGDGVYGSKLYHCMLHSQNALPMPPTYKVDSCSMTQLDKWLREGGQNN